MVRPSARRPASAEALYRALDELGAAPRPDPKLRPHGPKRTDTALLLGVLLAKTELDAAVRADPSQDPPRGLTKLLTGYRSTISSPDDETRLRLLSLRLVRSAMEATLDEDPGPLARAAGDAALAAAGLIDADRLRRTGATPSAIQPAIDTAAQSLRAATADLAPRHRTSRRTPARHSSTG
ncbi:hypothetical protein [Streptomyces sp. NPDC059122]|uniref:hypothetical protein n=1 Tax=Streptomyces sp. NPDC059122 TaxID=3346732 RepID=UPI0036A71B78